MIVFFFFFSPPLGRMVKSQFKKKFEEPVLQMYLKNFDRRKQEGADLKVNAEMEMDVMTN